MALSTSATSVAGDTRGDMMESAGRLVDKHVSADQSFYELSGLLRVATHSKHRPLMYGSSTSISSIWCPCIECIRQS